MRLLAIADLHLNLPWLSWLTDQAKNYDLICIAGDLQNAFSGISPNKQVRLLTPWLTALPTPTILCSGNHDYWAAPKGVTDVHAAGGWLRNLRGRGNIIAADDQSVSIQGCTFNSNGWTQLPADDTAMDVLITHAPPSGCPCASEGNQDNGDGELWDVLKEAPPRLILSGHIHSPKAYWSRIPFIDPTTLVLVPGYDANAQIPAHWVVDFTTRTAVHSSSITISLDP